MTASQPAPIYLTPRDQTVRAGLPAMTASQPAPIYLMPRDQTVGAGLPAMTASQPAPIYLTPRDQTVGAGLPAMTASQPAPIYLMPHDQIVGAGLLAKAAWQATKLDCVHIHCCGNGHLGFRPDGGSLSKSAKVSKALLPHHSAPRLGSVCPNAGLNPYPRIQACVRPAWFNGAPEIKSRARSRAARFASWLPSIAARRPT